MASLVRFKKNLQGFTLLEIIVAVAILGSIFLLSTFGLAKLQQTFAAQQVDREITNALSTAARRARIGMQNGPWGVYIPYDASSRSATSITVFHGTSYATRTVADDQVSSINKGTQFTTVDFSGAAADTGNDHEIVFNSLSGSTTQYGSIVVKWLDQQRTITIDPDGFAIRLPL